MKSKRHREGRHGNWEPPWLKYGGPRRWPGHRGSHSKRLFLRFTVAFGFMVLLVVGGMATLAFLITRLFDGSGQTAFLVWIGGLALIFGLPVLGVTLAMRAFRGIAVPLAGVMAAADSVAEGDLGARVPESGRGGFRRLDESFNRMVAELERTDQLRKNLTADVAHELRTPLHVIQGNLEGLLDRVYEPTPEHINATLEEIRLLARLVDDLGTLSLSESGQLPLVIENMDLDDTLTDVVAAFRGEAEMAGIELRVQSAEVIPPLTIKADVGRIQQVLGNLVSNAMRHTREGGSITLRASTADSGARIEVSDTGEGIDAKDLPFIFDRFWRGDKPRIHKAGVGSGLGLAIARQLVQAHGGAIEVRSEVGVGTTFVIDLPG